MKTIKNSIIALLAIFAVSCSNDDTENRQVIAPGNAPVLQAPEEGNVYVLNPANMDDLAERFVWTAANFGDGVVADYDIEIDNSGDEFDTPVVIATTKGTMQIAISTGVLNTALLALDATPFESAAFQVRIKAHVAENILYSNPVEINVTPYTTETPRLWVTGSFQADSGYGADWTPADGPQLKANSYGDTNFEGYVYIATDETGADDGMKFTSKPDFTGTNYGMGSEAGKISATGDNLKPTAGYYLVKVNTDADALTYSMTSTEWGVVGNSTPGGWDNSTPMTYDAATKKWTVTVALTPQTAPDNGWKFRANNAWDLNLGDAVTNGETGELSYGGSNIGVSTAGTYKITLDLSNPRAYTYTVELQ
jgi:hypothetical protein